MEIRKRINRLAVVVVATLLMAATSAWGAVSISGPSKPLKPNGATVNLGVLFSGETGTSATISVTVSSDPDNIISSITGNGSAVSLKKGKGKGKVVLVIAKNSSALPRSATLEINSSSFTLNQLGLPCKVGISPAKSQFEFFGGPGSFDVFAPTGCEWGAEELSPWITLDSSNGSGSGQVAFTVGENDGKNRGDKIIVTAVDPVTKAPLASKVHTVLQKEQKLTGTVKIGPPTPLDTPYKAAKAYRTTSKAIETVAMLNELLGVFGPVGIFAENFNKQPAGVNPLKPMLTAMKPLQPVLWQTRKVLESATDISTEICSSGTALVDGLIFDPVSGELVDIASKVSITFSDCVVEGETINGLITARGVTINQSSGRIAGNITIGKSIGEPLSITGQDLNVTAFLTLKLAFMVLDDPTTATIQADGYIDAALGQFRALIEMKGIKAAASMADAGPDGFTLNGLVRETTFLEGAFFVSNELRMNNFVEIVTPNPDPANDTRSVEVNGMFGQLTTPADSCNDGNFDIATLKPLKMIYDEQLDGTLTINGATIVINGDGSITVTVGDQTATYNWEQLMDICSVGAL